MQGVYKMDFDDDLDACIEDELRILDEIQEETNYSYPVKRLHSPEERSSKRVRTSSENDDMEFISANSTGVKCIQTNSENEDIHLTSTPGSLSHGHPQMNAPIMEKTAESHRKPLDVINLKEKPKDLLLAMDEALRKKEAGAGSKRKKRLKPLSPPTPSIEPPIDPDNQEFILDAPVLPDTSETSALDDSRVEDEAMLRDRRLKSEGNVVKQIPLCVNYLSVTGSDGRRLYVTIGEREVSQPDLSNTYRSRALNGDGGGVMSEEFYSILDQARKLLRRHRVFSDQASHLLKEDDSYESTSSHSKDEELWVNKYSPRSYIDLLSEENINRALLYWLKSWDKFVFGRSTLSESKLKQFGNKHSDSKERGFASKTYLTPSQLSQAIESDASRIDPVDGRPVYKVALLSGPPGLGKTTLAHVVAKHAGYCVVEMNASDDRSADAFRSRLDAAIGSRGAVGPDGRLYPVCLVIDEIDGAPGPTIDVLVNAIKTPFAARKGGEAKKSHKKPHQPLLRPVICICNNLYSPSLKNLRPVVLTVRFPEPDLSRIASRLWSVTKLEGIRADMAVLTSLAEKSERDIRSCLNTLQFIRTQGKNELLKRDVHGVCFGQKDTQRTLFTVWQDILSIPNARQLLKSGRITGVDIADSKSSRGGALRARFEFIHQIVTAIGETEKIVQGLFENYLNLKFKDTFMHSIVLGCEWLLFYDRLNLLVGQFQDYSLLRYTSYLPVFFHLSYAVSNNAPKLQFPKLDFEAHQKGMQAQSVLDCIKASPSWRSSDYSCLVTEVLPHLYDIIHPPGLKPMNTQLYSAKEKALLGNTVNIMIDSGLTFRQERSSEGEYVYRLEPDLDLVTRFPGTSTHKGLLSYSARQMIAQEINLEKMRRIEKVFKKENEAAIVPSSPKPNGSKVTTGSPGLRAVSVQEQIRLAGHKTVRHKVLKDFFGRPIVENSLDVDCSRSQNIENKTPLNQNIWFKFKEGYSNAIRRPVKIRDLFSK